MAQPESLHLHIPSGATAQPESTPARDATDLGGEQQLPIPIPIPAPLRVIALPRIIPHHHFNLASQGWTTITYDDDPPRDALYLSAQAVLGASRAFFALPTPYKQAFRTRSHTDDGWTCIEGEKEFITLRSRDCAPDVLRDAAAAFWAEAGCFLDKLLGCIAESLGLPARALTVYSEPCVEFGVEKYSTMLRLFRYEGSHNDQPQTVAEAHKDLGLLSLVISDVPGLEVWSHTQRWFPVEKSYRKPAATVLVGRELELLSNRRYRAGGHQVLSYPTAPTASSQPDPNHSGEPPQSSRYSAVFILRAHSPVLVDTDNLTSSITGQFDTPIRGVTARELFTRIRSRHFNINATVQERVEQRRKLAEKEVALLPQARK